MIELPDSKIGNKQLSFQAAVTLFGWGRRRLLPCISIRSFWPDLRKACLGLRAVISGCVQTLIDVSISSKKYFLAWQLDNSCSTNSILKTPQPLQIKIHPNQPRDKYIPHLVRRFFRVSNKNIFTLLPVLFQNAGKRYQPGNDISKADRPISTPTFNSNILNLQPC